MNILIADSRIPAAPLLAAELCSRDVQVTLAAPSKGASGKPDAARNTDAPSALHEVSWNPFSWLSTDSLVFEAASQAALDALILLFDLNSLAASFAELSPEDIILSTIIAYQKLAAAALRRFQAKKAGRIAFMLSKREERASPASLTGMRRVAAASAEAAFERFAEETAFVLSQEEGASIDTVLIKSQFESGGFISWAAGCITEEGLKNVKVPGKWLSRGGGGFMSIFQRRT